jgi:tyrosine-protein kinase Etk/Wzc
MAQYELNFNDYWRIIKKKKWLIVFSAFMVTVFSIIFTVINTPTLIYQASASIQIEKNTSLTGLYMESVSWNYGGDLATRAAIIKSYSMVEKAAKNLGLIDSTLTSDEIKNNKKYFSIIEGLKSRISTEQEGYTNLINITVKSHNPTLARDLANTLAKTYQEENFIQKNSKTENAIKALEKQLENAEEDYRQAVENLQIFRQSNNLLTLDGKTQQITSEMLQTEEYIEDLTADIAQINRLVPRLKEDQEYFRYINLDLFLNNKNINIASMQQKLNQSNTRLNELNQYYKPEHPTIKNLKKQIELIKNNIIEELTVFQKSLQQLRIIAGKKLEELNKEYAALPYQSQQVENLKRELQTAQNIYQELKVSYMQSLVKKSENVQEVFLIRPAFLPTSPINSVRVTPTAMAGLIIGLIFGIILAFVAESLDTTFRTIDDIEQTLGTQVQGIIPYIDLNEVKSSLLQKDEKDVPVEILQQRSQLMTHYSPKSTVAESYRSLRTNINFSLLEKNQKTIMVTSSVANEGKTNVAMNLSISMAQTGLKTLLVETDLRRPRVSKIFGIERSPGLTDYILNRESLDKCIRNMSDILMGSLGHDAMNGNSIPGIEYLNILPAGKLERNPSEIIAGKRLDELIKLLKEEYDIIIFDSAPIIQATDAVVLSAKVDTNLVLYYQGKISRNTLRRAISQLEMLKANILGVVINGMKADITADYIDYKYKYDYLYSYGDLSTSESSSLLSKVKTAFIEDKNVSNHSFWQRINKFPAFMGMLFIAILAVMAFTHYMNQKPLPNDEQYQTDSNEKVVDTASKAVSPATVPPKPAKLKEIQESLNLEPVRETEPSVPSPAPKKFIAPTDEITDLKLNSPYTIRLLKTKEKQAALAKLKELKNFDLNAFLSVDFSDSENKNYILCLDIFGSEKAAKNAVEQMVFLNISKDFEVLNLPYSLQLSDREYNPNNEYHFSIYNDEKGKKYYFAAAFESSATANIFRKANPSFNHYPIIKR